MPPIPKQSRTSRHRRIAARDSALLHRFQQLYHRRRLRLDEVYDRLAHEFYLQPTTVARRLRALLRAA